MIVKLSDVSLSIRTSVASGALGSGLGQLQPGATPEHVVDMLPSFQHGRDAIADGLPPLDRRLPLVIRIGHLKGVDDNAVGPGQNLRIENL